MDSRKPLLVDVRGEDIATLKEYSQKLKVGLYRFPSIVDLEATLEHDTPEYRLIVDRQRAADLGLTTQAIAGPVSAMIGGRAVSTFEDETGEARDVFVRLPPELRRDPSAVQALRLAVPGAGLIPVGSIARYELSTTPSEINRMDLSRQVVVTGNTDGEPLGTAVGHINEVAGTLNLPPGYRIVVSGENEIMVESFGYMVEALILAIIFVYLILAAQFESFIDPLSIMLSLPLSIVGMATMLLLTGDTVNMMSLIGLIMLMGLVTKNAILLVDFTKVLRGRGVDRRAAIIQAGRTRLRPIIMTTAAMIFGMLPLATGYGSGGEMRSPMARAVVGGLITSTLLTLVVVPVVYSLFDDVTGWLRRRRTQPVPAEVVTTALLLAAIVLFPAMVHAQITAPSATPPGPPIVVGTLTMDEALNLAARSNHDIEKARQYRDWVEGRYLEERAAALPRVTFNGTALRQFDDTQKKLFSGFGGGSGSSSSGDISIGEIFGGRQDAGALTVNMTQTVFTWGQIGAGIRAARVGFAYAAAQLRRTQQDIGRDVANAYYDIVAAKELVLIAEDGLAQKERHLDETKKRIVAGASTDYDVLAAEVSVENARPAVIRSRNLVRTAKEQLRWLLGAPVGDIDVAPVPSVTIDAPPVFEEVLQKALAHRPELAELSNQRSIYGELVTIAKAGDKPRVDFAAGYGKRNMWLPSISSGGTAWNATIVASVPLFDGWKTKGRVAQARTDLSRAAEDELKVRDGITIQVRTAVDAVQEAADVLTALAGTVKQAERLLFLSEKGFELGVKTRLEVQDAQSNLTLAKANFARAERDYRIARVNLEWVAGGK
jgi:HAE1 family hydrophobic/amphiphilic exporter-1